MVSDEDNNTNSKSLAQSSPEIKQEAETMFDLHKIQPRKTWYA